jgi:hypothetical protein
MTRKSTRIIISRIGLLVCGTVFMLSAKPSPAQAQTTITRHTVDGGGGSSQGGATHIEGTIGQPDAGLHTGGGFQLRGGFWIGATGPALATETPTPSVVASTATATPTGTISVSTPTLTPTAKPVPSGLDVKPDPLDQFIDARDIVEWVSRLRSSNSDRSVLFAVSIFWDGEYLDPAKTGDPTH